jgi:hypothetical protein
VSHRGYWRCHTANRGVTNVPPPTQAPGAPQAPARLGPRNHIGASPPLPPDMPESGDKVPRLTHCLQIWVVHCFIEAIFKHSEGPGAPRDRVAVPSPRPYFTRGVQAPTSLDLPNI